MYSLVFGSACYGLFLAVFLYLFAFVENLFVPKTIDSGDAGPVGVAIAVNLGLIALFGVQHSIMARPAFKRWLTRFVPKQIERSLFVLATCLVLILTFWQWRPITTVIWDAQTQVFRTALFGISLAGWGLMLYSSFLIDHFDLFGLRQVVLHWRGRPYTHPAFQMPLLYRLVRNPLMLGLLIAFWFAPTMTLGHLLFSVGMTVYILIGVHFEERDLARSLGEPYRQYRRRTPMLIPGVKPASAADSSPGELEPQAGA